MKHKSALFSAIAVAVIVGLCVWSDVYFPALVNVLRIIGLAGIVGIVTLIAVVVCFLAWNAEDTTDGNGYYRTVERPAWAKMALVPSAIVSVLGAFGVVFVALYGGYLADKVYVERTAEIAERKLGDADERVAYDLAVDRRLSDKGDLRGTIVSTRYVSETAEYTSLMEAAGFFNTSGYSGIVEQSIDLDGSTTVERCEFSESDKNRIGGWFGGSLEREIAHLDRGLRIDDGDAYGYCDGETPMVVVPVKELEGFYPVIEVPRGVALYNGDTGELELLDEVEAGDIPGPVYPISLAARQREALGAYQASFTQWMFGTAGYSDASGEEGDPNGSNPSEFAVQLDGEGAYLTHLTIRSKQASTRIAGISAVTNNTVERGQLADIVVYQIPTDERRESNVTVASKVKADYADELATRFSAGMEIFEIIPTGHGTWAASLGSKRTVQFRMEINADGSSCLLTPAGDIIRCVDADGVTTTSGTNPDEDGESVPVPADSALSDLSDAELAQLQEAVTDELLRRLQAGNSKQ